MFYGVGADRRQPNLHYIGGGGRLHKLDIVYLLNTLSHRDLRLLTGKSSSYCLRRVPSHR